MMNLIALDEDVAADGNSTGVAFGPAASSDPANQFLPGQTVVALAMTSDAFDGTVEIEGSDDGGTTWDKTPLAATDLTTGKSKAFQVKMHEHMRLVVASRTAGSASMYLVRGS